MRLKLYLYGICVITTEILPPDVRRTRIASWRNVYGHGVDIRTESI